MTLPDPWWTAHQAAVDARARPRLLGQEGSDYRIGNSPTSEKCSVQKDALFAGQSGEPQKRNLSTVTERRVRKTGIRWLHEELASRRLPGSAAEPPQSLMAQLLGGRQATAADGGPDEQAAVASTAQSDLRSLNAEQLLAIHARVANFLTEPGACSKHSEFLATMDDASEFLEALDVQLFEKLAWGLLIGAFVKEPAGLGSRKWTVLDGSGISTGPPPLCGPLRALGLHAVHVLGAVELLNQGWGADATAGTYSPPALPECWVLQLDAGDWPGPGFIFFHSRELWVRLLDSGFGVAQDIAHLAAGQEICVVLDRSSGVASGLSHAFGDRMLCWELSVLDPQRDDVLAEMRRASRVSTPFRARRAAPAKVRRHVEPPRSQTRRSHWSPISERSSSKGTASDLSSLLKESPAQKMREQQEVRNWELTSSPTNELCQEQKELVPNHQDRNCFLCGSTDGQGTPDDHIMGIGLICGPMRPLSRQMSQSDFPDRHRTRACCGQSEAQQRCVLS
eukprot:gnl/TRDRNA2_/TRDRNA2_125268_c0_seq2.p1 gnl/TRDRNA2_/TRDRNA2_125268_c0~~gnl/TRDRNA2_/TRDRNA2_125268_c0_seq2.p1  ORF type:complete len:508 (-),score=76.30 gnl/TRDRNA2_/TRDRNA2_125268_c0_seq2:121-1644(-)